MIGIFFALSVPELEAYLNNSKLLRLLKDPGADNNPVLFDIDKAWDALAYLASELKSTLSERTAIALEWLIYGNKAIDETQDLGYGPAHYLLPEQVKEVNEALAVIGMEDLRAKYDSGRMNELNIYPGFWDDEPDSFRFIETQYERLKNFYSEVANDGKAIVMYIN